MSENLDIRDCHALCGRCLRALYSASWRDTIRELPKPEICCSCGERFYIGGVYVAISPKWQRMACRGEHDWNGDSSFRLLARAALDRQRSHAQGIQ